MYQFADESPLTRPETFDHRLRCRVQAGDPFDELARLINGGGQSTEAAPTRRPAAPSQAAPPAPSQAYGQPAEASWQPQHDTPVAAAPQPAPEPSFDLGQMRRAVSDIPTPEPSVAHYEAAPQPFHQAPPPAPVQEALPDLSQFEAQLASLMALPQDPQSQAAPAWQPEPQPVPAARVAAPAPPPPSFDPNMLATPSVPETEVPTMVEDSIPSMREMEFALGNELEAALDSDFGAAASAPSAMPSDAVGIPASLMAAAAEREFPHETAVVPDVMPVAPPPAPRRGRSRAIAAGLASLALFGGTAAVAWSVLGPVDGDDVPVILASAKAAKDKPIDAGGAKIPNRDAALFKKDGANHQTALRRGSEAPLPTTTVRKTKTVRINPTVETQPVNRRGLATRKVRTVVVKPDGTIVTADVKAPDVFATDAPRIRTVRTRAVTTAGVEQAKSALPRPATPAANAPRSVATSVIAPRRAAPPPPPPAPVEVARVESVPVAPVRDAPEVAAVELPSATHDGYVVQISSRRTPESAQKAFRKLQGQFASLLGDRRAEYQRKDIEGRGTFYRVRVIADSKSDARNLCRSLKKAGGSCFVSR